MSLFNELQGEIIERPQVLGSTKRIRSGKKEKEERKTEKQIRKEMKAKLPEDEYRKRYAHREYVKRKEKYRERYKKAQEELMEMFDEICNELYPDPINRDKFYAEKFRKDDTVKRGYRFCRWASRLKLYNMLKFPKYQQPFRIMGRHHIDTLITSAITNQNQAYLYLNPHMEDIKNCFFGINKRQIISDFPVYKSAPPLRTVVENGPVNKGYTFLVFEGMKRGKYMSSEMYLGKNSFIFGDVVVTQTGHLFRISLENNLPWLTKDTVESIHQKRLEWKRDGTKEPPPIYVVRDAYLIKICPNERETLFYIVPT